MAARLPVGQEPGASVISQEGIESTVIECYDIMVIGMTGQGKSTTADKILIANPDGIDYCNEAGDDQIYEGDQQRRMEDLTIWVLSNEEDQLERVQTRLKNLVFYRKLDDPHDEINKSMDAKMAVYVSTSECELFSNETTNVRVLDVPGFFGMDNPNQAEEVNAPAAGFPMTASLHNMSQNHLAIMRSILRIQAAMRMKFQRILYFLPFRGPIEKGNMVLQQELQLMAYYFGDSIFQSIVLVATVPGYLSRLPRLSEDDIFPQAQKEQTQRHFQQILRQVLSVQADEPVPNPPVIFVSLADCCETVLEKVKAAEVEQNGLELQFVSSVCARCSMKIGLVRGEKVAGAFGNDLTRGMPYEESTCHPILVPKYTRLQRIKEGIAYIVSKLKWKKGENWPNFDVEMCPACGRDAGQQGCMQIGQQYVIQKGKGTIVVDHSHRIDPVVIEEEHRELAQGDHGSEEEGDDIHEDVPEYLPDEHEPDNCEEQPEEQQPPVPCDDQNEEVQGQARATGDRQSQNDIASVVQGTDGNEGT